MLKIAFQLQCKSTIWVYNLKTISLTHLKWRHYTVSMTLCCMHNKSINKADFQNLLSITQPESKLHPLIKKKCISIQSLKWFLFQSKMDLTFPIMSQFKVWNGSDSLRWSRFWYFGLPHSRPGKCIFRRCRRFKNQNFPARPRGVTKLSEFLPKDKNNLDPPLSSALIDLRRGLELINEIKTAFTSLKANKSPGYDDISVNIVKKCFNEILCHLQYIFTTSFNKGIFPDKMKIWWELTLGWNMIKVSYVIYTIQISYLHKYLTFCR